MEEPAPQAPDTQPIEDLQDRDFRFLRDSIGQRLLLVTRPGDVKSTILALLDDTKIAEAYAALTPTFEQLVEVAFPEVDVGEESEEDSETALIRLLANLILQVTPLTIRAAKQKAPTVDSQAMMRAIASSPMGFMGARMPPAYKRAYLGLRIGDLSLIGLQAATQLVYPEQVLTTLHELFVDGYTEYLSFLAGIAKAYGDEDAQALAEGLAPLDIKQIELDFQEVEESRRTFLAEAAASGRRTYPTESDDASEGN